MADALTGNDKMPNQSFYKIMGSTNDGFIAKTHNNMGNVNCLDGHVGMVTKKPGEINKMIDL